MDFDRESTEAKIANLKSNVKDARIILWDIDGTLMHSNRSGAYKEYFIPALERVYGSAGSLATMQVSGMTDTQIAYESLRGEGFTVDDIFDKVDDLLIVFREEMTRVMGRADNPYSIFDGVREALDATHAHPLILNSLLTGNLSHAAEIKLRYVDLWQYFEFVPHAFGEFSHDRRELAKEAGRRINEFLGVEVKPEQFTVIGDTPNDIICAKAFGAKSIALETGRNHDAQELGKYDPDLILKDLTDAEALIRILKTI
jgi:phosphoglycolate phosphatase-like HAD superfamily hydrolase